MAFALSGALTSANSKTGTTFTITAPASGFEAGKLVVVMVASDNASTTDTTTKDNIVGVTDNKGNTYANASACTNGQGAAQGGATVGVWYSIIGTSLNSGIVTVTNTTTTYARAATISCFSFAGASLNLGFSTQVQDGGTDPSITISGKPSKEYLWIGGVADENNATVATPAGFTAGGSASSGGGAATNMAVQLAYAIETGTAKTYTPAVIGDCAALLGFFEELGVSVPATGQALTASVGQVTVVGKANVTATAPAALTASVGTATVSLPASVTATGQQLTGSVGTVGVTVVDPPFVRVTWAYLAGTAAPAVNVSVNVTGQQMTASTGVFGSIAYVSSATASASASVAMPAHAAGDLLIAHVTRPSSALATIPGDWTIVDTRIDGSNISSIICYKWAASSSEIATGFTSADILTVTVYRNTYGIGGFSSASNSSTQYISWAGFTLQNTKGQSWVDLYAVTRSPSGSWGTMPGFTQRISGFGQGNEFVQDSNSGLTTFTSRQSNSSGFLAANIGQALELMYAGMSTRAAYAHTVGGQQLSAAVGQVTVNAVLATSVNAVGQQLTAEAGAATVSGKANVGVTGNQADAAVGAATISTATTTIANVSGQQLDAAVGQVSVTGKASVTVTGNQADAAVGTVTALTPVLIFVSGLELAANGGAATVSVRTSVNASGQQMTASVGAATVSGKASVSVSGQEMVASVGQVTAGSATSVLVTSPAMTAAVGAATVGISASAVITSVPAMSVFVGDVTINQSAAITVSGVQMTAEVGAVFISGNGIISVSAPYQQEGRMVTMGNMMSSGGMG